MSSGYAVQPGAAAYGARQIAPLLRFTRQIDISDYIVVAIKDDGARFEAATSLTSTAELIRWLRLTADSLEAGQ